MTTFMAVIFLWQFPPLYFAIFSGNSNPGPLFLLFGFPESPNGNSHPCFLPFSPKIANLTPCFCYLASRPQSPATARPQQKPRRNGLEAAQAQPASGQPRADTKKNDNLSGCRHFGAENGARTRDLNLGKVALYQLSYFRVRFPDWDCKYTTIF